tara:strand:- start:516 stop:701 length:186 start_codon:yes stop_codon:yes gene_type:complete
MRVTSNLGPAVIGIVQDKRSSHTPKPFPPVDISKTIKRGYAMIMISEIKIKKTIILNKNIF